jgi:pimeloyl-ACP methyl ester carboxylesterase
MQVTANGIAIEVEDHGDKDAPVILLVMGFAAQLVLWPQDFVDRLVAEGFRVVRFDNRDIGLSHKFEGVKAPHPIWQLLVKKFRPKKRMAHYTLEDMAADAVGVLDALEIDKAHVIGASMGGMISQIFAAKYPDRLHSLTPVMTSTNNPKLPGPSRQVRKTLIKAAKTRPSDPEEAIALSMSFFSAIAGPKLADRGDEIEELIRTSVERSLYPEGPPRQMAAIIDTGDLRDWTRRITAPTLVIHGADDPLIPHPAGADVAANIDGARLELVAGMGHDLPEELLPDLTSLVVAHCRAVTPATENSEAAE